jgi:hypothetical protein
VHARGLVLLECDRRASVPPVPVSSQWSLGCIATRGWTGEQYERWLGDALLLVALRRAQSASGIKRAGGGSSPQESFEKSLQIAIYLVRALLALATGRTRSHAGGTEHIDQLSLRYTKEELTGLAKSFLRDLPGRGVPLPDGARPAARRRPASGQSDHELGLDLVVDGMERMAYR